MGKTRIVIALVLAIGFGFGDNAILPQEGWEAVILNICLSFFYGLVLCDYFLTKWAGGKF